MHGRHDSNVPFALGRALAAQLPNARFVPFETLGAGAPWRQQQALIEEIRRFLGVVTAVQEPGGFRTILFTDVEGSTALTQRLGDARARELLRQHERIVREALKSHGGAEVKTMGDGFMASFSSASKALECAIAMQRAFAERNESAEEPIRVRIGLNAGEPIAEDEDLFGTAVNLAARICGHAEAGQILAPIVVRELAAGKQFLFADLGETALRGFEDPVRLFEVRWRES
jgi:class 3 adenylate cyclase